MAALPEPIKDLRSKFEAIVERVRRLENAASNKLSGTGLSVPGPGVVQVDGDLRVVDGAVLSDSFNGTDFAHPGTSGNYFGDDGLVLNNAYFRPGSVSNDALTNPVIPGVVNLYVSNFGLPTYPTYSEIAGVDLTVPPGCTQLQFTGTGSLDCYNSKTTGGNNGAGGDYMYPQVRIGGSTSPGNWATGVSGSYGNATASRTHSALLTGLTPGATIRAAVHGSSDYGIAADVGNLGSLSAQLSWLR